MMDGVQLQSFTIANRLMQSEHQANHESLTKALNFIAQIGYYIICNKSSKPEIVI
jgi:hypothetical protein